VARACLSCSESTLKLSCLHELEGKTDGVDEAAERGEIQRACESTSENAPALSQDRLSEVCDKCLRGTGDTMSAGSVSRLHTRCKGMIRRPEKRSNIRTRREGAALESVASWQSMLVALNSARRSCCENFVCEFPSIPHPQGPHPFSSRYCKACKI
jgi:hypothetical protein